MKSMLAMGVVCVLSVVRVVCADNDTIRVPKGMPMEMLAELHDEFVGKTLTIEIVSADGERVFEKGTQVVVYQDSALWRNPRGEQSSVSTERLTSITLNESKGISTFGGVALGTIAGFVTGAVVVFQVSKSTEMTYGTAYGIIFGAPVLGGIIGGVLAKSYDATVWIFEH